jgi:hypothetical protein
MIKEKQIEILKLVLLKVLCYKQSNGKYVIFKHDEENTEKTIDEIMDILKVAILED